MDLKKLIDDGLDMNAIAFDKNAETHQITPFLVEVMRELWENYIHMPQPTTLLYGVSAKIDFETPDICQQIFNEEEWRRYYYKIGGIMPPYPGHDSQKTQLVILCNDTNAVFGAI